MSEFKAEKGQVCGAPAVGGPCRLARGHNMGKADVPEAHEARGIPLDWPCDDYYPPLTCWTVPLGRKVACEGCRTAFPNGAEVQVMYREASR